MITHSELLNDNMQLRKQVLCLLEDRARETNEMNDIRAALAKSSFKPANQLPETKLEQIVLDLQKFGADLIAMIQRGKSTCIAHIDDVGNVIDINDGNSSNSSVEEGSGTIPS